MAKVTSLPGPDPLCGWTAAKPMGWTGTRWRWR
jgi:hypothetical protein